MNGVSVKQEIVEASRRRPSKPDDAVFAGLASVIELSSSSSSSDSDSDSDSDDESEVGNGNNDTGGVEFGDEEDAEGARVSKKLKLANNLSALAVPPPEEVVAIPASEMAVVGQNFKQFWKAGDYEGPPCHDRGLSSGGMDHVRVHPKFLHSNATSHKWALGAFAELLDNALDEVCNGATYVNIDMLENKKDGSRMLLIEDNGGGMDPDKMRHCMSLGYSAKSKVADAIGQYGNGFKTSTMRLGADVIVFSRSPGKDGKSPTKSIGLLSYTFLRSTGKEDIVVPMLDYERGGGEWRKIIRSSSGDWDRNLETMVQWSPFCSEADLLRQFNLMIDHGTRIIIYNLWEDDQGLLELDFDADPHDIQLRGVNRDEKNIKMAKEFPNSRHFLTYKHSLRSYASILYLRPPPCFRIILRGKDVEHHNVVNDMMMSEKITYKPQPGADGVAKDLNMAAVVTVGFVKDAKFHIDVQGFNVYHKNRLIKPFWRIWNAAGSDGRGVIGVLEANFVEPAHDKQGFERTTVLARLEARLLQMQKNYWSTYCHKIGYAPRRNKNQIVSAVAGTSSQSKKKNAQLYSKSPLPNSDKYNLRSKQNNDGKESEIYNGSEHGNGHVPNRGNKFAERANSSEPLSPFATNTSDDDMRGAQPERTAKKSFGKDGSHNCASGGNTTEPITRAHSKGSDVDGTAYTLSDSDLCTIDKLKQENLKLMERIKQRESEIAGELLHELQNEKEKCKSYETQLNEAQQKIRELNKEQEALIDIFSEERDRRDEGEKRLRKKLKEASNTIQELLEKVKLLETLKSPQRKTK